MTTPHYRLLIVEDNPGDARLIAEHLRDQERIACSLVHAASLSEALSRLRTESFDVVLLDLGLPDSQGLATVTTVLEVCPGVATVVLSGLDDEELSSAAVRGGAQDYLLKSELHSRTLVHAIRYSHERKARENERVQAERELELLSRLTRATAEAPTFDAAVQLLLREVCRTTGWVTAESWIPAPAGDRLIRGPFWVEGGAEFRRFHTLSTGVELELGEGLPGRAWATRRPVWEPDAAESAVFCRNDLAREAGLRAAMVIPVLAGEAVEVVLAFYHTTRREEDSRLLGFLGAVAAQLGAVLERRRAEEALRRSEIWRRQLMDTANEGICVIGSDATLRYVNERAAAMIGTTTENAIGKPATAFLTSLTPGEVERRLDRRRQGVREVAEIMVPRPDAEDTWLLTSASPILGDDGSFEGSLVMLTDITDLKRTEQSERVLAEAGRSFAASLDATRTVQALARSLVPELGDTCVIALHDGSALHTVAAEVKDPFTMEAILAAVEGPDGILADPELPVVATLDSGEPRLIRPINEGDRRARPPAEAVFLRRFGSRSAVIAPIPSRAGGEGVVILASSPGGRIFGERDRGLVAELGRRAGLALENARLYQEARQAVRARDDLLGVVAHDLRNPLGAVSMYATLIEEEKGEREDRQRWSASIRRSVDIMDRLIQDLLDITRIEAGRLRIEKKNVAVGAVFHEIREMFAEVAARRDIEVTAEVAEDDPAIVLADRTRLIQVIANLVGNALKFTPAGGAVTLSARTIGADLHLSVRDSGSGIPPEQLPHVFDRFWQAANAPKSGAGLGLAIARGLVEAHGGTIRVESAVGAGTTFHLTIPIGEPVEGATGATPALDRAPRRSGPPRKRRVLIVDDHELFLSSLEEILRPTGAYDVVGRAGTGEEALEKVTALEPDLVLMDLEMPGQGGLWAMRQIRILHPDLPILALTGSSEEDTLLPAMQAGASAFVCKQEEPRTLLEAVDAIAHGLPALNPRAQRLLAEGYRQQRMAQESDPLAQLAHQERAILALVAAGYNSKEIGKRLFLSAKTVDTYRSRLMRTLGLRHRSDLVRYAIRTGLLRLDQLADDRGTLHHEHPG